MSNLFQGTLNSQLQSVFEEIEKALGIEKVGGTEVLLYPKKLEGLEVVDILTELRRKYLGGEK